MNVDACSDPPSGWSNVGLVRIDNKPFESPRGLRRGNPGYGRQNGMPFVSQRGRVTHHQEYAKYAVPSAPSYGSYILHLLSVG